MSSLQPTIAAAISPFITPPLCTKNLIDMASFNDDDVYVYHASTREFVKHYGCYLANVRDARAVGFTVESGNTWAKGLRAKHLGLWSAA